MKKNEMAQWDNPVKEKFRLTYGSRECGGGGGDGCGGKNGGRGGGGGSGSAGSDRGDAAGGTVVLRNDEKGFIFIPPYPFCGNFSQK